MWRSEILWTEEVATAFKRYEDQLRRIFADWRKRDRGDTKFMSLDEFTDLLEHCEIVDSTFSDNDARVAFVHAIQDVKDEMKTDRHTQMSFVEFVHGLAHVANIRDWSRSLLGNQLDVIERIERVIKALISGARRHAQTAGRNLACTFITTSDRARMSVVRMMLPLLFSLSTLSRLLTIFIIIILSPTYALDDFSAQMALFRLLITPSRRGNCFKFLPTPPDQYETAQAQRLSQRWS